MMLRKPFAMRRFRSIPPVTVDFASLTIALTLLSVENLAGGREISLANRLSLLVASLLDMLVST